MSTEDNKTLIRQLFDEIWNKGNTALAEEMASPDTLGLMQQLGVLPPLPIDDTSDKKQHT